MAVSEAAARSVATAGRAVVFAGGTVVIAILGLIVAGIPFLTAAAVGISTVVLIMVLASITLLPAFLAIAGPRIGGRRAHSGARWLRWGDHVSRHALVYAVAGTALLVALALPALDLRLGTPDESNLPTTRTERRAYDLVAQGFGPGINGPLVVVADAAEASQRAGRGRGRSGHRRPSRRPRHEARLPRCSPTRPRLPRTTRRSPRSSAFARRSTRTSAATPRTGPTSATASRSGCPTSSAPSSCCPSCCLTVVFRSVLVPLKAAVLNLLGVGAAYGVIVVVFQWGWAADLIGLESTLPIIPFIPVFMFAVLFGLSMDYEVFLLSRIREHYLRTGDNQAAVIHGIARTARVITAAALIMIAVFGGFVFDEDPRVKMFGLGLATAILVDATIIRLVLVPAIMQMLGDANWWLPRWLGRVLPERAGRPVTAPAVEG